jgi:hypothetical protein
MRFRYLLVLALAALSVSACDEDGITESTPGPAALVRFVNAIVDTGTVDLRFVDRVENLPTFLGVPFRASSGVYQRVIPGTRPVRVFVNSSVDSIASIRLVDSTITLEANKRYTLVYAGRASGNQDRLVVIEEPSFDLPDPATTSIAVRALHAAVGTGNVDVHIAPANRAADANLGPDPITTAVATITDVAYLEQTAHVTVVKRDTAAASLPLYQFGITPAASTTLSFRARPNTPGAPPTLPTVGASPGVQIGGSVLTAVVFAGATPGTRSATATNTTPTVVLLIDKALDPP